MSTNEDRDIAGRNALLGIIAVSTLVTMILACYFMYHLLEPGWLASHIMRCQP